MLPILAKPELRDPEDGDQASTAQCLPALGLNNSEFAGDCGEVTFPLMWFLTPSRYPRTATLAKWVEQTPLKQALALTLTLSGLLLLSKMAIPLFPVMSL